MTSRVISFDGQVLSNPSPWKREPDLVTNPETLLDGTTYIQTAPINGFSATFKCQSEDSSEFTALEAKVGLFKTLVIDGTSYTKCCIQKPFDVIEDSPGKFEYNISFIQHTSSQGGI